MAVRKIKRQNIRQAAQKKGLTRKQKHCARLIGGGMSQRAAAKTLNISRHAVDRWAQREDFQKAVRKHHRAILEQQTGKMMHITGLLYEVLEDMIEERDNKTILQIAKIIIPALTNIREQLTIREELDKIKSQLEDL